MDDPHSHNLRGKLSRLVSLFEKYAHPKRNSVFCHNATARIGKQTHSKDRILRINLVTFKRKSHGCDVFIIFILNKIVTQILKSNVIMSYD